MKIKTLPMDYDKVMELKPYQRIAPKKPGAFFRWLVRALSARDLKATGFSYTCKNMEKAGKGPWLVLMNHSSFLDLEIASQMLSDRPYNIVCTSDGFIGKEALLRAIGCFPTNKFTTDTSLLPNMKHLLRDEGSSVLMFPEASYSFDGTATALPRRMSIMLKRLGYPVVIINTRGSFARDPLFNMLQLRNVKVSAEMYCLFSPEELKNTPGEEIDRALDRAFSFDNFRWQQENMVKINEPFRADGLQRILYKCPVYGKEGCMKGKGTEILCESCGFRAELDEYGFLRPAEGSFSPQDRVFDHIPDWYAWERSELRRELEQGSYLLDVPVTIRMLTDLKAIYEIGSGRLIHSPDGFSLYLGDRLIYEQGPGSSYGLYADFYWYELGDMICIGDSSRLYYCFPPDDVPVAKARLAAEELYKIKKQRQKHI